MIDIPSIRQPNNTVLDANSCATSNNIPLESIELVDFMCHSHFEIKFNKPITCICGRNGSGKSAIMIALGILFGQRARSLERGNSYKSLIKTGCTSATIQVTLNNIWNFNEYGSQIILKKTLKETTAMLTIKSINSNENKNNIVPDVMSENKHSNFSSKNRDGSFGFRKLKKYELQNLVSKYKLNFDNPLNFLTQELSKKFLNVASPKKLYEFYYIGTEFKAVQEELEESFEKFKEMKEKLAETKVKFADIQNSLKEEGSKLEFINLDYKKRLKHIEEELEWVEYNEVLENIKSVEKTISEYDSEIENVLQANNGENPILTKCLNETSSCERRIDEINLLLDDLRVSFKCIDNDCSDHESDLARRKKEFELFKQKDNKEVVMKNYNEVLQSIQSIDEELRDFEHKKEQMDAAVFSEINENKEKERIKDQLQKQLRYLQQNVIDPKEDERDRKHQLIKKLIRPDHCKDNHSSATKVELKFKDEVIGPVGQYINLIEARWYKPVSLVIGNTVDNYIVFNRSDKNKLLDIFKENSVDYHVSTMTSKKTLEIYNKSDYKTILDVLEFNHKLIKTMMMYFFKIEQKILIESRADAYKAVSSNPVNTDCAYTITGDKIKNINGSLSDFKERNTGKYFFEDKKTRIKNLVEKISKIQIITDNQDKHNELNRRVQILVSDKLTYQKKETNLKLELNSYENVKENDSSQIERKLTVMERMYRSLKLKRDGLQSKIFDLEAEKSLLETENNKRAFDIKKAQEEARSKLRDSEIKVRMLSHKRDIELVKKRELVEMRITKQEALGSEIVPRKRAVVEDEKMVIKEKISLAETMPKKEEIEEMIQDLTNKRDGFSKIIEKFDSNLKATETAIITRKNKRDEIKNIKTVEAAKLFLMYTRRSGYEGSLEFNHDAKELHLKMKMPNAQLSENKNMFSGGERSFAGICFLLCLWKSFDCPIKVLDEFDVFMDSINRKNAINSIFEFIKYEKIQLVLITPLDLTSLVDTECDIKVLQKNDIN